MSSEFEIHQPSPILIVISGPSGVGKDTVVQRMKERGLPFHFVVTATTREMRPNETNGKDYWFVSKALEEKVISCKILSDRMGSDHCPVVLEIDL